MTSQLESFPQDAPAQPRFCPRRGPLFLAMRIYGHGGLWAITGCLVDSRNGQAMCSMTAAWVTWKG